MGQPVGGGLDLDAITGTGPVPPAYVAPTPPATARPRWFRPDIDGLRAVAIALVVLYHCEVPAFSGGFIGVDVFFVISGYLITRKLLEEGDDRDGVRLLRFWAKRIRRLVPALALMVAVTLVAAAVILPRISLSLVAKQGASAAVYLSNITFARQSQGYFATSVTSSPFLHTWSLGVEEQFYIFWPLLLAAAFALTRRRRHDAHPESRQRRRRMLLVVVFVVLAAGSFALNLAWSSSANSWAFYSLPTRAWEFGLAGLLALTVLPQVASRWWVGLVTGVAGLAMLAVGTVGFTDATPYPSWAALVPVVGTLLLIISGETLHAARWSPISRLLATGPFQWVGRVSYSWYLWHWPFIVLTVVALSHDTVAVRSAAAAVSLVVAAVAYQRYETPLRFAPKLLRSPRRTFVLGAVATVVALALAGVAYRVGNTSSGNLDSRIRLANTTFIHDINDLTAHACTFTVPGTSLKYCVTGDTSSSTTVVLIGDSHAAQWMVALSDVAASMKVRLVGYALSGCPGIDIGVRPPLQNQGSTEAACASFHRHVPQLLQLAKPKLVIIGQAEEYAGSILGDDHQVPDRATQLRLWAKAYDSTLGQITRAGAKAAVIVDNPFLASPPNDCLAKKNSVPACEPSRASALAVIGPLQAVDEHVVASHPGVASFSATAALCDTRVCHVTVGDNVAYIDTNHLSSFATASMEPQLRALLADVRPS